MKIWCAVLLWWFAVNALAGGGFGRVVGPFASVADCERIRDALYSRTTTPCWKG